MVVTMQAPDYVLKIEEGVLMPDELKKTTRLIRKILYGVVVVLVCGSFLFQENLFLELSFFSQLMFVLLFIKFILFEDGKKDVPCPIELQFFKEYLVIYRPKRYYSQKLTRREYNTIRYDALTRIKYVSDMRMFHFYGDCKLEYFKFKKDGTIEQIPSTSRMVKGGMIHFSTNCTSCDDNETIRILNQYVPVKVDMV